MAVEQVIVKIGLKSAADLSTKQFYALQLVSGTDKLCSLATAATLKPGGVLQNKPTSGKAADALFVGISKVKAGGTIHNGDPITAHTDGTFVACYESSVAIGSNIWGRSLSEMSSGDIGYAWINVPV